MELHIHCEAKDVSRYVLLMESQEWARGLAGKLDASRLLSKFRGFWVYGVQVGGMPVTVASTGNGGPTTAIVMEELSHLGADSFMRLGSCFSHQPHVHCGDIVIATGSVRAAGGTADHYLPAPFPAVPDFGMTAALVEAAKRRGAKVHVGLGAADCAPYAPVLAHDRLLRDAGILFRDMDSDALFVASASRGWRASALLVCNGVSAEEPEWSESAFQQGKDQAVRIAIDAMTSLALADGRTSA